MDGHYPELKHQASTRTCHKIGRTSPIRVHTVLGHIGRRRDLWSTFRRCRFAGHFASFARVPDFQEATTIDAMVVRVVLPSLAFSKSVHVRSEAIARAFRLVVAIAVSSMLTASAFSTSRRDSTAQVPLCGQLSQLSPSRESKALDKPPHEEVDMSLLRSLRRDGRSLQLAGRRQEQHSSGDSSSFEMCARTALRPER